MEKDYVSVSALADVALNPNLVPLPSERRHFPLEIRDRSSRLAQPALNTQFVNVFSEVVRHLAASRTKGIPFYYTLT